MCSYRSCRVTCCCRRSTPTSTVPSSPRRSSARPNATWSTASPTSTPSHCEAASPRLRSLSHITPTTKATSPPPRFTVATALAHGVDLVVSNDRRLRREINALGGPLRAVTGDEFAQQLLADQPDGIDAAIDALVAKRTRRPVTRGELIDQLAGSFPRFAAELRRQTH